MHYFFLIIPFISNVKNPTYASKRDVLEQYSTALLTLQRYLLYSITYSAALLTPQHYLLYSITYSNVLEEICHFFPTKQKKKS